MDIDMQTKGIFDAVCNFINAENDLRRAERKVAQLKSIKLDKAKTLGNLIVSGDDTHLTIGNATVIIPAEGWENPEGIRSIHLETPESIARDYHERMGENLIDK